MYISVVCVYCVRCTVSYQIIKLNIGGIDLIAQCLLGSCVGIERLAFKCVHCVVYVF